MGITWHKMGTLYDLQIKHGKGVYLFIYDNIRIIYVGSTNDCFCNRITQHKLDMLHGGRTCWKPNQNEDIYNLMTFQYKKLNDKDYTPDNLYNYYLEMFEEEKVWIPGDSKTDCFWEPLFNENRYIEFNNYWLDYIQNEYQKRINIWIASFPENPRIVESSIQKAIRDRFPIAYYIKRSNYSWLGKQELSETVKTKITFTNFPEVESETLNLLENNFRG